MGRHQRLEKLAVVGHAQVQQFVCDDEILEPWFLIGQIDGKCDNSGGRAGTPLPGHVLNADKARPDIQLPQPVFDAFANDPAPLVTPPHRRRQTGTRTQTTRITLASPRPRRSWTFPIFWIAGNSSNQRWNVWAAGVVDVGGRRVRRPYDTDCDKDDAVDRIGHQDKGIYLP